MEKSDTIVKLLCKSKYTKPNFCSSATKLLKLVYTLLNVSFLKTLVVNLSFSLQILTSRKEKELFFSRLGMTPSLVNYASYKLSDLEKILLVKGLNYALPPIKLKYGDYMKPVELFYCEIRKLSNEDYELEKVKTEIKKEAYSSFDNYNFWNELNISKK